MIGYNKLRDAIGKRGFTLKYFAEKVGITRQGIEASIENGTVSAKVLEKMSDVLDVPVSFFFEEDAKVGKPEKRHKSFCQGCNDKDKTISVLEENAHLLHDKIHFLEDRLSRKIA
jgi:transcriptional regulator with XRE-family HTH domain